MTTFKDVLAVTKSEIREVGVEEVKARLPEVAAGKLILVDTRQRDESAEGTLEGSLLIPRGLLEVELPSRVEDRGQELVLFCAGGTRSALAARVATTLGYTNVTSMAGGFGRWKQAGAPFHMPEMSIPAADPEQGANAGPDAPTVTVEALQRSLASETPPVVIDVREDDETGRGYVAGSVLQPRGFFEMRVEGLAPDKAAEVVLVSSGGVRAAWAQVEMVRLGYSAARVLEGGYNAWVSSGGEVEVPRRLSDEARLRYSRHLLIPEVGEEGQLKLQESKVLLMGAGGLGSPAAYYLAAAGVGTLGIIDSDVVDRSNLQRQILHTDARVGVPKVESAELTLKGLNPDITINAYNTRLTSENVMELFEGYDLVVDGGDNFPTRYLVNDACVLLGIPCVHGSVYRFEGQVTVFKPKAGPCYRCLYPEPPPPELAPSCAEAGVLGVLPGIIGLLQANEALKVLLGAGDPLIGRLLHVDALGTQFRTLKLRRDPECPVCREGAEWKGFIDYEQFCGIG